MLKASESGDIDVVGQWLRHPDVEVDRAENDWTPLQKACYNGHANVARALLDKDATVDLARDDTASTPLYLTCYSGHVDAARLMLEKGAEVDQADNNGWTPWGVAKCGDHDAVVALPEQIMTKSSRRRGGT